MQKNTEAFINRIRLCTILWDSEHKDYKNLKKKAQVWKAIANEFGTPVEVCKRRWKTLRGCFLRDISNKKGMAGEDSCWKYSPHLEFLRQHVKRRSSFVNCEEDETIASIVCGPKQIQEGDEEEDDGYEYCMPEFQFANDTSNALEEIVPDSQQSNEMDAKHFVSSTSLRKKRILTDPVDEKLFGVLNNIDIFLKAQNTSIATKEDEEDELFCRFITKKMKKLPPETKNGAQMKIIEFLNKLECPLYIPNID